MPAKQTSQSFVTQSQKCHPFIFAIFFSSEANHQVQPILEGITQRHEYQEVGISGVLVEVSLPQLATATLSHVTLAPALFWLVITWYIVSYAFTLNLSVHIYTLLTSQNWTFPCGLIVLSCSIQCVLIFMYCYV